MVFFNVTGSLAGHNLEAEVYSGTETADRLVLTCGSRTTSPVRLPARLAPGKKEVKVQSGHFELKLPTIPSSASEYLEPAHTSLFDATALEQCAPTSFICSSCSLPLVQSTRVTEYKDLPSEHWEELVDAWMCHTDQKLHEHVVKHASNGFWPMDGQALVGGSYIVFEKGAVVEGNLVQTEKDTVSTSFSPGFSLFLFCWLVGMDAKKADVGDSYQRSPVRIFGLAFSYLRKPSLVLGWCGRVLRWGARREAGNSLLSADTRRPRLIALMAGCLPNNSQDIR